MVYASASNDRLLDKQSDRESSARSYPRYLPMAIREVHGVEVTDADGDTYYDYLAGAGTLHLGHNHPVVVDAVESAMAADRPMHTLDITTPTKEAFVDTLFDSLRDEFAESAKIQFCSPAGTDAVEAALKLTKTATGNRSVLSFRGGYHGMTHGALGLMGDTDPKADVPGTMANVHHLPYPYPYHCPFGVGEDGHEVASEYVERLLADPERGFTDPAAMVLEPVQGEGGSIAPPIEWLREMRRITRERDVRGRGLLLGAEMVDAAADSDDLGAYPPDSDLAEAVQSACFDRGLLVERGGREGATVRFLPPLIISKEQVEDVGRIFRESVEAAVSAGASASP